MKLSERQEAALLALNGLNKATLGADLAAAMGRIWRETSLAAAHQGANGLVQKGLAKKGTWDGESHVRYWLTVAGLDVAAALLEAASAAEAQGKRTCRHCRNPIVLCASVPSHAGCGSGYGWIHSNPEQWGHGCQPRSGAPYAQPDGEG